MDEKYIGPMKCKLTEGAQSKEYSVESSGSCGPPGKPKDGLSGRAKGKANPELKETSIGMGRHS